MVFKVFQKLSLCYTNVNVYFASLKYEICWLVDVLQCRPLIGCRENCVKFSNLRKCSQKIRNGPNSILRGLGETDSWKKQKSKIPWHCPFKVSEEGY